MSSTISLVIGAVGLLAAVFALIVVLRRPPGQDQPAVSAPPAAQPASAEVSATAQWALEEASQEAGQVRARAETDAAAIMREAGLAADKAAQASRDADEELRVARAEARDLRADLERREARLPNGKAAWTLSPGSSRNVRRPGPDPRQPGHAAG